MPPGATSGEQKRIGRSMTGYARVVADHEDFSLAVTIKSVNHRYWDAQIRLPAELERFEPRVRRMIKKYVRRGQIQLQISLHWNEGHAKVVIDPSRIEAYLEAWREIAEKHGLGGAPDLAVLLRLPGSVVVAAAEMEEAQVAALETRLTGALEQALEELNRARAAEGEEIVADMRARALGMRNDIEDLERARQDTIAKFQQRLEKRLTALLESMPADPQRVLQEAAVLADRADVSEELQRFRSHARRLLELLDAGGELGKKADFLSQEMNREVNTILSKSTPLGAEGLPVTETGLRLKSEIEKIREQAQNLE